MKIYYNPKLKQLARNLRNNSTLAEVILWNGLKAKQVMGYQFMRQKPIGNFILDFYCSKLKLAIEVDGESHGYEEEMRRDEAKDRFLNQHGITVLRYDDSEVKRNVSNVIEHLMQWIESFEKR